MTLTLKIATCFLPVTPAYDDVSPHQVWSPKVQQISITIASNKHEFRVIAHDQPTRNENEEKPKPNKKTDIIDKTAVYNTPPPPPPHQSFSKLTW